jgi:two-component system, NarL family, sensor histidine kinase FusK
MVQAPLKDRWPIHVGVAAGYGLLYVAIHPLSTTHWPIHAGVRLACLLLFPYRFWPALLIGEGVSNFCEVYPCMDSLGLAWVIARSVPPFAFVMPIVWWCRTYLPPLPAKHFIDIRALIVCVVLVSIGGMLYSSLAGFVATPKDGSVAFGIPWIILFFLGPYLAILSITPWVLLISLDYQSGHLWRQVKGVVASKLTLDIAMFLVPTLALLEYLDIQGSKEVKLVIPMAMFMPLTWLTLKHGWRAAAVGSPMAIACIALPIPLEKFLDENLFPTAAQVFLVLYVTCLLALGARISAQLMREERGRRSALNVQQLARRSLQIGEQRMRQTSRSLECLADTMYITHGHLLKQVRRIVPNIESYAFYKQTIAAQSHVHRLAESMHPIAWRERGLPAALNETIARVLDEAGIAYRCEIVGRGFTRLMPAVLTATYRVACEAIVYVSSRPACAGVKLVLRGGETNGKRWVVLRVEGFLADIGGVNTTYFSERRKWLALRLGANALDANEMRDHARVFDGVFHMRTSRNKSQITVLLHDVPQAAPHVKAASTPMRLWVK